MKKKFLKYLNSKKNDTYCPHFDELLLLKGLFSLMDKSGTVITSSLGCFFLNYTLELKSSGLDYSQESLLRTSVTPEDTIETIKCQPFRPIALRGFIEQENNFSTIVISKKLLKKLSNKNIKQIIAIIDDKIKHHTKMRLLGTPTSLTILGQQFKVQSWSELFIKVCETMLLHQPYIVAGFDQTEGLNSSKAINFSYIPSEISSHAHKLNNSLYVKTDRQANEIALTCAEILTICGYQEKDLLIEFI